MAAPPQEAQDEFEAAIKKYLKAQGYSEGVLMDWLLVAAEHHIFKDGSATGISISVSREQPAYRTNGLANYAVKQTVDRF